MKRFLVSFFTLFLALNLGIEVAKFFSGAAHKGYNAEARQYISSLNKSQAAYYTEEGTFSNSFNDLQVGIRTKTKLYEYSIQATKNAALSYAIPRDDAYEKVYFGVFQWQKKINFTRSHVGAVFLIDNTGEKTSKSIICAADFPGKIKPAPPTIQNEKIVGGAGTKAIDY